MKNLFTLITLFIVGFFYYALTLKGVTGNPTPYDIKQNLSQATMPLELSPERGRFILTYSLVENKSFSLSEELAEAVSQDVGTHNGKNYIYFGPGVSMLALPFYMIGKVYNLSQVFSSATIMFFAAFNLVMIYQIGRNTFKLPEWIALLSSIIFGFGSTSWSYAVSMYQHHVTTFFILSSFYAVCKYKEKGKNSWFWAFYTWSIFGYSLFVDYPNAILMLPVMIFFFLSSFTTNKNRRNITINWRSSFLKTSLVFAAIMLIHGYYNYVHFGSWKKLSGEIQSYKQAKREKLEKPKSQDEQIKELANKKSATGFFKEEDLPRGFWVLLFSRDRGIFLYTPIFALGLLGILSLKKKSRLESLFLLLTMAVNFFLYSSWGDPWGGWAFGPRYLIPSMAILSIFVGVLLNNTKYKIIGKFTTLILFTYSSAVALLGVLTTSQVPPKSEADVLKMKYNFLLNWDYFMDGRSSSFVYNEIASKYVTLQEYFLLIFIPIFFIVFALLFVAPFFGKKNES